MSRRARLRSIFHALAVLGLLLGLVVQPLLSAVGELHAMTHDGVGSSHVAVHAADEGDLHDEAGDGDDAALHVIHHLAHCCGHATALSPAALSLPPRVVPEAAIPAFAAQAPPGGLLAAHFRPPITA